MQKCDTKCSSLQLLLHQQFEIKTYPNKTPENLIFPTKKMSNSTNDQLTEVNNSTNDGPNHTTTSTVINDDNTNNTTTAAVDGGAGSSEDIAKGISSILSSVIRDFDSKAVSASHSQDNLLSALDRLTAELDQLLEDAPLPVILQQAAKLSSVRTRVSSLNALLRSIQRRIDNVDRMISVGVPHNKSNAGELK